MRKEEKDEAGIVEKIDALVVRVYPDRREAGRAAALSVAERMRVAIGQKGHVRMMFAAAPSQVDFLQALTGAGGIEWNAVTAFHMDEYLGLPPDHPQLFGSFLHQYLFGTVSVSLSLKNSVWLSLTGSHYHIQQLLI